MKYLEPAAKIVAPLSLVVGILYYTGWYYTRMLYWEFGLDPSLAGLRRDDYVLRNYVIATIPIFWFLTVGLVFTWFHGSLQSSFRRTRAKTAIVGLLYILIIIIGALLFFINFVRPIPKALQDPVRNSIVWTTGVALVGYGYHYYVTQIHRKPEPERVDDNSRSETIPIYTKIGDQEFKLISTANGFANPQDIDNQIDSRGNTFHYIVLSLIIALFVLGLFTTTSHYARAQARNRAEAIIADPSWPRVNIYSKHQLELNSPNIDVEVLNGKKDAFKYRYVGAKLFSHSENGTLLFTNNGSEQIRSIILKEATDIRIEVIPNPTSTAIPTSTP